MSVRFSRVTAMVNDKAAVFLVGGVPSSQKDLNSWTAFEEFTSELRENTAITVNVEVFAYGEGDIYDATPEEIAYFYKRIEMRPDFIETRTEKLESTEFFMWLEK